MMRALALDPVAPEAGYFLSSENRNAGSLAKEGVATVR
jgi:hypothetical protein